MQLVSLRNKFLLPTILLILIGMGLSTTVSYIVSRDIIEGMAKTQIHSLSDSTTQSVISQLTDFRLDISQWSNELTFKMAVLDTSMGEAVRETASGQLAEIQQNYEMYEYLLLTDRDGKVVVSSVPELLGTIPIPDRTFLQNALNNEVTISQVLISEVSADRIFMVAIPLKEQAETVNGLLLGAIRLQYIDSMFIAPIKVGDTGYAFMFDADGRVLAHPKQEYVMNLMIADFDFGRRMLQQKTGEIKYNFEGRDKMAAFRYIEETGWTVGVVADEPELLAPAKWIGALNAILVFPIIFLVGGMIFLMTKSILKPLNIAVQAAEQVAEGKLDVAFDIRSRDEIGQMLNAVKTMIVYIQNAADVAERIAKNDLQVKVFPQSDQDLLNHSLAGMIANLRIMQEEGQRSMAEITKQNEAMKQQSWLKDGISQLNIALSGDLALLDICSRAISVVGRYVDAGCGVLYTYNSEHERLMLQGTFAFTERDHLSNEYQLGEGLVGQVALERTPILLKHLTREEIAITTGTVSAAPVNTYTFPLIYNDNLYGVSELASFEAFGRRELEFIDEASHMVATILFSALQREQVQELLQVSKEATNEAQEAKEQAQQQAEEARRANVLLEEQQQQLQQQNEEFRQMSAQLEEQQQQLNQQWAELERAKNELESNESGIVLVPDAD